MVAVFETAPEVAVTVTCDVPVGVGIVAGVLLLLLPQPVTPAMTITGNNSRGNNKRNLRLLAAPNNSNAAKGETTATAIPAPADVWGAPVLTM